MTIQSVALNGVPIEDLGLGLSGISAWKDATKRTYQTAALAGGIGQVAISAGSQIDGRQFQLTFAVRPASFADRDAQLAALVARFPGLIEVSTIDAPTHVCYGLLESIPVTSPYKAFVTGDVSAAVAITCADPRYFDRDAQLVNIPAGTTVALPSSPATTQRLIITVQGATTNPIVLILTDQTGAEVQRMTLTAPSGTLGASNWLTIYCGKNESQPAKTIIKSDGTDLYSWLGSTEDFFTLWESGAGTQYSLSCAQASLVVAMQRAYWT
ncbi:MAG TPA: hypothetical protein VN513_01890 [Gemmatimonadales bacterium]|nr:hypothetical protein [Gemmatimonadales bacterium]